MGTASLGSKSPLGKGVTPYVPITPQLPRTQYAEPPAGLVLTPASPPKWDTAGEPAQATATVSVIPSISPAEPYSDDKPLLRINEIGQAILKKANTITTQYPVINTAAAAFIRTAIKQKYNLDVDPDTTYLHDFVNGHNSYLSFSGWAHNQSPSASYTLTQAVLANRRLSEDTPGTLDGHLHGIYTEGPTASIFDEHNEVKLLPSELMKLIYDGDFYTGYKRQLEQFWDRYGNDFRALSKAQFIASATNGLESGTLPLNAYTMVMKAIDLTELVLPVPLSVLNAQKIQQHGVTVRTFDINGYEASDILHFKEEGRPDVVLYIPGGVPALRPFDSEDALKDWVIRNDPDDLQRQNLHTHFSLYNRQDGATFLGRNGVDHALKHLAAGDWNRDYINKKHSDPSSAVVIDLFTHLALKVKYRELQDADTTITSSTEVNKQIWRERLQTITLVTALTAPFSAPINLMLALASLAQLTYGIDAAIGGDTPQIRGSGVQTAVIGSLGFTFGGVVTGKQAGKTILDKFLAPAGSAGAGVNRVALRTVADIVMAPVLTAAGPDAWLGQSVALDLTKAVRGDDEILTVDAELPTQAHYIEVHGRTYKVEVDGEDIYLANPSSTAIELDPLTGQWTAAAPLSSKVPRSSPLWSELQLIKKLKWHIDETYVNCLIGDTVFRQVRRSYNRGLKSSNKIYENVPKAALRADREDAAYEAIEVLRRPSGSALEQVAAAASDDLVDAERLVIDVANCGELSDIAAKLVMENGGHAEQWSIQGADHAFTVVGVPPPGPTVDFSGWKDVWIIDVWANLSCSAETYQAKLIEKMQSWAQKGKQITSKLRKFKATDPEWLGPLTHNPKVVRKRPTPQNPQPWANYRVQVRN